MFLMEIDLIQLLNLWLTEQWFVDAEKLSVKAKEVVNSKKTNFFPENWSKTYFQWMNNIRTMVYFKTTLVGSSDTSLVWSR